MSRVRVFAAGSLSRALPPLLKRFEKNYGATVEATFGPAGLLARAIEDGDRPDVFLSANLNHPKRLLAAGRGQCLRPWIGNALSLVFLREGVAAEALQFQAAIADRRPLWLRLLLTQGVRIGSSTPVADPGGDYAQALIRKTARYSAELPNLLAAKTRALVGGILPTGKNSPSVAEMLLNHRCDVFFTYASNADRYSPERFSLLAIPPEDNVAVRYGLLLLSTNGETLARMLSEPQSLAVMRGAGFR